MPIAIVLALLVVGSVLFHFLSPWWFTPIASNWGAMDTTVNITFWVTGAVFIVVNLFMAYAIVRFRHRPGARAHYQPENTSLELGLTAITSIGVIAMLAPGLVVWAKFVDVPEAAAEVEVVGQQWHWSYRLPGEDGILGASDARLITPDNPFGINAEDPHSADDKLISSNILHLPVNEPVQTLLRSIDVLHNFTVPQFRVKMDLVPGHVSSMWFTPTRSGRFDVMCEELCGMAHHAMRGKVVVESRPAFEQWLAQQPTFAETQQQIADADPAAGKAQYAVCASCHGPDGQGQKALNAPALAGQHGDYLKRQLRYYKTGIRGANEADEYGRQMAPMAATLNSQAAINNVVAYIETLPATAAPHSIDGDAKRGQRLYRTCAACHGADGQGNVLAKAPKLAGVADWYLVRQLENYKDGVRGGHADDLYGQQMRLMARILKSETAIADVVAHINTLPGTPGQLAARRP